jgi:tetratricopeptide (TPR) repeat protein
VITQTTDPEKSRPETASLVSPRDLLDPALAQEAAGFFRQQGRLAELEFEERREDRRLQKRQLELSVQQLRFARITSVMRLVTLAFIVLASLVLGVLLIVSLRAAMTSRSVVVEAFEAPASLAPEGLTGKVVASQLLDQLTRIQASTRVAAVKRSLSSAWTRDITVEVPDTHISLGELNRLLRRWLGNDLHIDGHLIIAPDGRYELAVRGDGVLPRSFVGAPGELARLIADAAEYVYSQSQPYLYLDYLRTSGRLQEALTFAKQVYSTVDAVDRPYILNIWAYSLQSHGDPPEEGLLLLHEALRLKPDLWSAYNNVMNTNMVIGKEQEAWRVGNEMRKAAGGRPGKAPELYYQNWDHLVWNLQARRAGMLADAREHGGVNTTFTTTGSIYADIDARLHDFTAAELHLKSSPVQGANPLSVALGHFVNAYMAHERGDANRAVTEMDIFMEAYKDPAVAYDLPGYHCWAAPIAEAAGRAEQADASLRSAGTFVDCRRFEADIRDGRGDWSGAQLLYAEAVALAPDLPAGYYSWGLALLRHGDLDVAAEKLAAANKRAPQWADPLKAWGDLHARRKQWREAEEKYRRALKLAPAWEALQQARERSRKAGG